MQKSLIIGLSRFLCLVIFVACLPQMAFAATAIEEESAIFLENQYLKLKIVSHGKEGGINKGGVISSLIYKPTGLDLTGMVNADRGGLLRERIPPIADLWAELTYEAEIVVHTEDQVTALVKSIPSAASKGVETKKYITLRKGSTSIETKWEITNNGGKNFSITPWLWNNVIPGKTDSANYYFPTNKEGLYKNAPSLSKPPTRNWLGAIDDKNGISISFIADYSKLAMNYTWLGRSAGYTTQEWLYTTIDLAPGESWDTTFYTNVVPLQKENDLAFASPEVTVGIKKWKELEAGKENTLDIALSSVEVMGDAEIRIEITGPDGYTFTAPHKFNVNLSNETAATINWTWTPPQDGVYLLKASLYKDGIKQQLGQSLQNPSPDIEIPLVAGTYAEDTILFPAWPRTSSGGGDSEQRKISGAILSKETDMVVWSVPSLEKIFLDDIVDLENSPVQEQVTVDLAKREREAVQVVLSPEKGKDFNSSYVTFGEFKNEKGTLLPEGSLSYNPVGYVRTELGSRFDPKIRTGYWPDPLLKTSNFDVKGGQNTPIWITVYAAPDVEPGIYEGNLTIKTDAETIVTLPMSIKVWSFELPEMPKLKTALDIRNIPVEQIDSYIDNFLEHRISPRIALRYPSVASLKQDPDFVQFDAKMESLLKKGLNTISVGRDLYTDPELAKKFVEHLKVKGWLDMAYVYLTDEPTEETFPAVKELAAKWKAVVPELKIMITTYPKEKLVGSVDLWTVPGMNDDPEEAKKALERGEELWWYHTDPLHPQANFLIDMPAVDARAAFWQSWQGFLNKGYTGFLYAWSTWAGKEDPWKITGPFFYRNGLESQIYPSPNGPVNSIRWEVMRDGVEDYDYCFLLWDLLQRVEKEMPGKVKKKEVVKAKNLLEFPVPLTDYVGKQNIVEEAEKWRKEVAESIISITSLLETETYTAIFNSNGGSEVDDIDVPSSGSTITAPAAPTKEGYIFEGWYKEAGLENKWNFETDLVTSDITLHAKWVEGGAPGGSTISALYDGSPIAKGTAVLAGKELVITVVGKGSDSYNYVWSGAGTSGQTTDSITINPVDRKIDATVMVTGLKLEPTPTPTTTPTPTPTPTPTTTPTPTEPPIYPEATPTSTSTPKPTPTPVSETKVEEGQVTAKISVKVTTDTNGREVAAISETQLADAIAKATAEAAKQGDPTATAIRIEVSATADSKAAGIRLPAEALKRFVESKADTLIIATSFGSMTLDKNAVEGIVAQAAGMVTITAAKVETSELTDEIREKVGDRPVVSFEVTDEEKKLTQLGAKAEVSIPYVRKTGENPNAIVAYKIDAAGKQVIVIGCKYDATAGTLTFKTEDASTFAVGYNKLDFADVTENAYFYDAVTFAAARGITLGIGNGSFGSNDNVTRAQALVMIMRAFGIHPDTNADNNFSDAGDTYYTGYLAAAKKLGIAAGVGDNRFAPDQEVTRQELFVLVYNALKNMNELPIAATAKDLADFKDAGNVADEAVELFVKTGIIQGSDDNILPDDSASRAQFVQILYNIITM
ncbi:S-layer homology domain-containing protein [Paenibacillus contaminans]|nr:S-layer homology domain-containing protein [Paenibacillus contaminans]